MLIRKDYVLVLLVQLNVTTNKDFSNVKDMKENNVVGDLSGFKIDDGLTSNVHHELDQTSKLVMRCLTTNINNGFDQECMTPTQHK